MRRRRSTGGAAPALTGTFDPFAKYPKLRGKYALRSDLSVLEGDPWAWSEADIRAEMALHRAVAREEDADENARLAGPNGMEWWDWTIYPLRTLGEALVAQIIGTAEIEARRSVPPVPPASSDTITLFEMMSDRTVPDDVLLPDLHWFTNNRSDRKRRPLREVRLSAFRSPVPLRTLGEIRAVNATDPSDVQVCGFFEDTHGNAEVNSDYAITSRAALAQHVVALRQTTAATP